MCCLLTRLSIWFPGSLTAKMGSRKQRPTRVSGSEPRAGQLAMRAALQEPTLPLRKIAMQLGILLRVVN